MVDKPRSLGYSSEVSHFQRFVGKMRGFWALGVASMANPPMGLVAIEKLVVYLVSALKPSFAGAVT